MLFRRSFLDGLRSGAVTLAFRRWRRPSVKAGGRLLTPVGELWIGAVCRVELDAISAAEARRAGYGSLQELLSELTRREDGEVYRIELGPLGPDPRIALRGSAATGEELEQLRQQLRRLDSRATAGPWTLRVLEVLSARPGVRAGDLCRLVDQDKDRFKRNVRKLKSLGLTESLETGYRLSPRGAALLDGLRSVGRGESPGQVTGRGSVDRSRRG